jgi:hypothetical protein
MYILYTCIRAGAGAELNKNRAKEVMGIRRTTT